MQDTDAFLTRTIVGAPRSARLGRRVDTPPAAGPAPDLHANPWIRAVADEPPPTPAATGPHRRGPTGWLGRHALGVALAGVAALLIGVALAVAGARAWI